MKKIILTVFIGLMLSNSLLAQKQGKIKISRVKSSICFLTKDSSDINFKIAEKVALNFNMQKFKENSFSKIYKYKGGLFGTYFTAYSSILLKPVMDSYIKLYDQKLNLNKNESVFLYGFSSVLGEGKKADRNYSRLMMSAYKQEIDLDYLNNPNNFTTLVRIDKSEYWRRNWINMGYGMSYIAKNNPFMGSKGFAVGFLYILEALYYIPIFGGAFYGKTQHDKIAIPLIGLTSLFIWKGVIGVIGNKFIKLNRNIRNSGYKIPNNFEY